MPALPTTNLTLHCDASDNDKLFTTANGGSPGVHTGTPADGSAIAVWDDEGDGVTNVALHAAVSVPVWRSSVPLMRQPCLDCDRTGPQFFRSKTQDISSPVLISSLISTSAFTIVAAFLAESITATTATIYECDALLADGAAFVGIHLRDVSGTYRAYGYNWDGAMTLVPSAGAIITLNTSYVVMFRHQSGSLYWSLNGGTESSTTSGNTSDVTNELRIGVGGNTALTGFDGRIGEFAIYNVALSGANLSDAVQYFTDKWLPPSVPTRPSRPTMAGAAVRRAATF